MYQMKNTLKHILLVLLLLLPISIYAQSYTFRGVTMAEGLSDLLVNSIYKDSEGFVWLGTDNCLDRFDGVKIKHYPFPTADVKRKRVNVVLQTAAQELWVGNGLGLWQLNKSTDQMTQVAPGEINFTVYSLFVDSKNMRYVGTEKGLFVYKEGTFKRVMPDKNMFSPSNRINGICQDATGLLWLATEKGVFSYHPATGIIKGYQYAINGNAIQFRGVAQIKNTLYLSTATAGIITFDIRRHEFDRFPDLGSNIISSISTDGKDMIFAATDGNGAYFLSHSRRAVVRSFVHDARDKASIRSNSVYSMLVDKEGIVWIGFYQSGFDYSLYQSGLFSTYTFPPYFTSADLPVRSFYINGHEKLIGTRDGLFYINEKINIVKSYVVPVLRSNLILSIGYYNGEYYIGTYGGGVSVFNPSTLFMRNFSNQITGVFAKGHVFCFENDKNGNLWIGTSAGLYCYCSTTGELKEFTTSNSQIPEGNVYEIFFDSTCKGWICTETGLAIYDPVSQTIKTNVFPEGFAQKEKIRTIYEDSSHNLHLLPDKGSMVTCNLSMTHFYRTPMNASLHGNAYMSVVEDRDGWLWFGCDDGLLRVKDNNKVYSSYNFSDGLPSPIFTNGTAYKDPKGVLWFGNTKGLIYLHPARLKDVRRHPYKIVLTDVLVNGSPIDSLTRKDYAQTGELSFAHNQNNVTFRFVNLSYTDPATMVYEYKMEGNDEEWHLLNGNNEVSYYDLPPGNYTFLVRIPGDESSTVSVSVNIALMYSLWFWLFIITCVAFAGVIVYHYRKEKSYLPKISISLEEQTNILGEEKLHEEKYKTNRLTDEECNLLHQKVRTYMEEKRPFVNPDLKIADLAKAVDTSSYSLSFLFNQFLNQSYYDFVNEYRIAEFKKMANDARYAKYTLTALAELCGFSSRASFFRTFKKSTGITPNEYIRTIGAFNQ